MDPPPQKVHFSYGSKKKGGGVAGGLGFTSKKIHIKKSFSNKKKKKGSGKSNEPSTQSNLMNS